MELKQILLKRETCWLINFDGIQVSHVWSSKMVSCNDQMPSGRASRKNCILREVFKNGMPILFVLLQKLLTQCWERGWVPQGMRNANIVSHYKDKNVTLVIAILYKGILLLIFVGKGLLTEYNLPHNYTPSNQLQTWYFYCISFKKITRT